MMDKVKYKGLQKVLLEQLDGDYYTHVVLGLNEEPMDIVRSVVKITLEAVLLIKLIQNTVQRTSALLSVSTKMVNTILKLLVK
jgi:hypothetical protein